MPKSAVSKDKSKLKAWLIADAKAAGFADIGITKATHSAQTTDGLAQFLDDDFEGDMAWLRDTADRRQQPHAMWGDARTAIVLGMNYGPDHDPMGNLDARDKGNISVYARGRDYHEVIKGKLKQLAGRLAVKSGWQVKVFVDTAPLMEKPLGQSAGIGWQGKHTNLVSRTHGSWLFLGTILTDGELPYDEAQSDHCGSCRDCLDICPTDAFPAPYRLDARRCISYLTIEHKGQIPKDFRTAIGNRIFGCDDCLAVCPWNKYAKAASEAKLAARMETTLPELAALLALDEAGFRAQFASTPVRRAGYERFLRNVLVAAGNSADMGLVDVIMPHLDHASGLVRGMAVWALGQLMDDADFMAMKARYIGVETDADVAAEWG
ncbi:tRNA epoxyqueuosine(34) reductase QueG [Candidatus Puniceispirillum marinum]|uniref:Iron-sulfur cluster binding protein n=1 Tax=Puniceispirillum marinum (strain IMCC1322) TaxID=488538 RepID=D5BNK6_PUNMI|nr:tRNA epoxyqueuosine(34) reductase QueG [Candidatus Puniceispirillum marinum]ADE38273.1 iron-sulfur cluster binding protein [Candidatus Puniceispirillum marinum IMCC1322]